MKKDKSINDVLLNDITGCNSEELEIVFGNKDLSSLSSSTIDPYMNKKRQPKLPLRNLRLNKLSLSSLQYKMHDFL